MNIFTVLTMIGGLALFLYGMHILGEGLAKLSGGKLESFLSKMTDTPLKGVLLGAGTTAVIQSSSATTVMVVGFVNSGIMQLKQAVGIIMGANIGTTITSWILSLSGIESDSVFVMLLKPEAFSPILAIVGVFFLMFSKSEQKREAGGILLGFAILMFGMDTMSNAVEPLKNVPAFTRLFVAFSNPFIGILTGTILTAVIQSSSASIGILQALCATGTVPFSAALPIIMGQNIGTCITALLSSVGANTNAKRAAFIHLYFNVIGTTIFTGAFYLVHAFVPFAFLNQIATPAGIAIIHSCFNVAATILLLPFSQQLVRFAKLSVPEKSSAPKQKLPPELAALSHMDRRFLDNPPFALNQCKTATGAMLALAGETAEKTILLISDYSEKKADAVKKLENYVDLYEDKINNYLFEISQYPLSKSDSKELSLMQHSLGNIERIADYSLDVAIRMKKMKKKKLSFSKDAKEDLALYHEIVLALVKNTIHYWETYDTIAANDAFRLENERRRIEKRITKNHKKRLKKEKCSVDMGFILSDILLGLKKIAEHCIRIIDVVQSSHLD